MHLQRQTNVLDLRRRTSKEPSKLDQRMMSSSSDESNIDSDKESKIIGQAALRQKDETLKQDLVEQVLQRGICIKRPLPALNNLQRFTF